MFVSPMQPPPQTSPFPAPTEAGGSVGSQDFKERAVVAMEVGRGLAAPPSTALTSQSPWQRALLVRQGGHASLPRETELAEKAFFQGEGGCGVELGTTGWPSTDWLRPKMWGGVWDPRTRELLGPPGPAGSPGTGVRLTPAPPKAELSPGEEGDVALSPCWGLEDRAPSMLSPATDLLRAPWDPPPGSGTRMTPLGTRC